MISTSTNFSLRLEPEFHTVWIYSDIEARETATRLCERMFGPGGHNPRYRWRVGNWERHASIYFSATWLVFKTHRDFEDFVAEVNCCISTSQAAA